MISLNSMHKPEVNPTPGFAFLKHWFQERAQGLDVMTVHSHSLVQNSHLINKSILYSVGHPVGLKLAMIGQSATCYLLEMHA